MKSSNIFAFAGSQLSIAYNLTGAFTRVRAVFALRRFMT
jgi:hypothetical protein